MFVEAKSKKHAKKKDWLKWALDEMDYDELPSVEVEPVIVSVEEVTSRSQVPKSQLKKYPWYNPSECHNEDRAIEDWVNSMTPCDISENVEWKLKMRMRELERIQEEIDELKGYLNK